MILSDRDLMRIWPDSQPGPASLDLRIGDTLLAWPSDICRDPRADQSSLWRPADQFSDLTWILRPGIRYLATTQERIRIPDDLAGFISARSSWGRDGLAVICGPAGFLDPGYVGRPTLELSVVGSELVIWPGATVCQIVLHRLESPAIRPYDGKYQNDDQPTPSRLFRETAS